MAKKKKEITEAPIEAVEGALSKTEQFIENNQKILSIIVVAIIVIVGGYLAYNKLYLKPLELEVKEQMFVAEQYFEKDSFNLALMGDGNYLGFIDIIDEYSITKGGKLAYYYAGISYLRLGEYDNAIDYLKKFDADDKMIAPVAIGAIGDAYMELGDSDKALSNYLKAANKNKNKLITPIYLMKAAGIYEEMNNYEKALEIYEEIEKEYPKTQEGRKIEKYISRAKFKISK